MSSSELARRGSWRAKARREQESAALRVVADDPSDVDDGALRALTQSLLDIVNAASLPANHDERVELIASAGEFLAQLARDPLAWETLTDYD